MTTSDIDRMRLLKSVFAASPDIITVTELSTGIIIDVNDDFEKQTGYPRNEVVGKSSIALNMWVDLDRRNEYRDILARDGVLKDFDARLRIKSGEVRLYQLSASIVEMDVDPIIVTIFRDKTEASLREERLRKNTFLLERAEEMARIGSWEFDYDSKIVTGSVGSAKIYGVPQESLSVSMIEDIPLPEYRSMLNSARDNHIKHGTPYDLEFKIRRQSDGAIVDVHARALWDAKSKRLYGMIRDTTEEKQAEAGLKAAIAERDALIGELYHRINNSLQTIVALLSLEGEDSESEAYQGLIERVSRRVRAIALVHASLYESKSLSRIDMSEFLERLVQDLKMHQNHGSLYDIRFDIDSVGLNIDAAVPCGIVLMELLDNAVKHAYVPGTGGQIRLGAHRLASGEVEVSVADDGPGPCFELSALPPNCLGLGLVHNIVINQLRGSLFQGSGPGFVASIRFRDDFMVDRV
ncbi:MAG: histidine kinase dimerization/phosphoacceptor domain -containing protein [Spirochaetia bacterium]|jgi:PAS domain S-box-containing protein|nr:histidine kinase dimerization/phosphoacceptor domain -containing protein [Spirochaetia bacterium]